MFPSKADRILSRFRPIAPKPLPIPPSGSLATDLSSTCASLDSFASSGKVRRSRKRRISASSGKCSKNPKSEKPQIVSAVSNNNAGVSASSLTQGNSDATVPRADLSHVSHSYGIQGHVHTSQRIVMEVSEQPCLPSGDPATLAAPFNHHLAGNLLEQARMFMVSDARKTRQQSLLPCSPPPRGNSGFAGGGIAEKDLAFMERAAASTTLPDRGASGGLSCSGVCMKGVGYGGGGFTEMIRGITHLPTAADVQSLMQARSCTPAMEPGVMSPSIENSSCARTSPARTEAHPRRLEVQSRSPVTIPCGAPGLPLRSPQAEDCTLPLLPNFPSKPSPCTASPLAASSLHNNAHRVEASVDHATDLHPGFAVDGSSESVSTTLAAGSRVSKVQVGDMRQANCEADDANAHPHSCSPEVAKILDGLAMSSAGCPLSRDGAIVDQGYLQQVYSESTDPVLLLDDSNQVLWFNKAYDRALKSVLERFSSKPATTGPYIDPLGHPTPLHSLVLNRACDTSKPVNATLWGFLRKLVMPEVVTSLPMMRDMKLDFSRKEQHYEDIDSSRLCLSVGDRGPHNTEERAPQTTTHMCSSSSVPSCRTECMSEVQGSGCVGKLTTVTLDSITEVHMGQGAVLPECVETVEARLGAVGSAPAFITDCTSRVRWVNSAFKQMLGYSDHQGNDITRMGSNIGGVVKHEPPDLTFVCSAEKIPRSAWAFSGLVNLEWMKAGKRRSMTVPCDVSRLVPAATWVWKFDLALSLSLNLCV